MILSSGTALAQVPGDALQLFSYGVSAGTRPDVSDGQIATALEPADWQAAYVRVVRIGIDGDPARDPRPMTLLIANDHDSLYIAVAVQLPNASQLNALTLHFDQATPGVLDSPGEYYVMAQADGSAPSDGHWNGSSWVRNSVTAVRGIGVRKGTSGAERLYNFELVLPLAKAPDALNGYLNVRAGDEVGFYPSVRLNTDDEYRWLDTTGDETDPSGWGQIQTLGDAIADRNVVSLASLSIVPAVDGRISTDRNWRYAFKKDIILTDLAGSTLDATLRLKETSGPDNLLIGMTIEGLTPAPNDYFAIHFDSNVQGRDRDFILSTFQDLMHDDAVRMTGSGAYGDYHFEDGDWVPDLASHGQGAAAVSDAGDWEIELSVPFDSDDNQDLALRPDDRLGALLQFYDSATGRSFWWSATINDNLRVIDPVEPVHNALGWGFLQTGGPFIQPIYPEEGDVLSGEYPLAVYALDPRDPEPGLGVEWIRYEVRLPHPSTGTYTLLASGELTRVVDPGIPIWTATLDTRAIAVQPNTPLTLVYEVYDGEVDPVSVPMDVYIDNSGSIATLEDPDVAIAAPVANDTLTGFVTVEYSATTHELLALEVVELWIDGALVASTEPDSAHFFEGAYTWNTIGERNGEHVIQVRAENSLGFESLTPAVVVVVDNEVPEVGIVTVAYPDGQTAASQGQTVTVSAMLRDAVTDLDRASVSIVAPDVDASSAGGVRMVDDGTGPDAVAGDLVFTAALVVTQDATGSFVFTINATDVVGNAAQIAGSVLLDNDDPVVSLDVQPTPRNGEVYVAEVLLTGSYQDAPDPAAVRSLTIRVTNAAGNDVNDSPFVLPATEERSFSRVVRLVEGVNEITVTVLDRAGNTSEARVELTRVRPDETQLVGSSGGTVTAPDRTSVVIPPGALRGAEEITVQRISTTEFPRPLDDGTTLMGSGSLFGPDGLIFHEPVEITLAYSDSDLDRDQDGVADLDESALDVFYWDGTTWVRTEPDGRDPANNLVTFTTNHFSVYALGVDDAADPFRMYWSRNPFVATEGTTAVLELPGGGSIDLRVYDLEGDLVRTIAVDEPVSGTAHRRWDGRNDFDRYVGSGIYIYVFEYRDASGARRVVRKPIGVVE